MPNVNDANIAAFAELVQRDNLAQYVDVSILKYYNIGLDCFQEVSEKKPTPTFEEYCESEREKEQKHNYTKTAGAVYKLQIQADERMREQAAQIRAGQVWDYIDEPAYAQQLNMARYAQEAMLAQAAPGPAIREAEEAEAFAPRPGIINRIFGMR